jgi:hypothetical protein
MKGFLGMSLLCTMVACLDTSVATDENTLTAKDTALDSHKPEAVLAASQNCVFIQWCDEPPAGGTWMVVGKVRSSCFNQCWNDAIINEFINDAHAVCGAHSLDDNKWRIECF